MCSVVLSYILSVKFTDMFRGMYTTTHTAAARESECEIPARRAGKFWGICVASVEFSNPASTASCDVRGGGTPGPHTHTHSHAHLTGVQKVSPRCPICIFNL